MRIEDSLGASLGGLLTHKLRAFLTMLGIVFGVGAVIAMQAIGEGARREALDVIEGMGLHNVIVKNKELSTEDARAARADSRGLTLDDLAVLERSLPQVDAAAALREVKARSVSVWTHRAEASVFGVSPGYFALAGLHVERGAPFDDADDQAAATVAVIGPKAARSLFGFEDPIGRAFKIDRIWVTVVGVLETKIFGQEEFEGVKLESPDSHVYLPIRTVLRRIPLQGVESPLGEIMIGLGDDTSPSEVAVVASEVMDRLHRHVDDWELVVPFELMEQSQKTQRMFNIVMGSIAGISLLVGGIGIMNIMLASVMERTREIGVRRALGAREKDVRLQFLVEALALSTAGGALGIGFGFLLARGVAAAAGWTTAVSLWSVVVAVSVAATVGLVSGAYPAFRAARLDPVECLHYE